MIFLRSVVGKLWLTILLLVSFVLLILTVLLLEFFENFHVQQVEDDLMVTASKIVQIVDDHEDSWNALEISAQLVGPSKLVMIADGDNKRLISDNSSDENVQQLFNSVMNDQDLSSVKEPGEVEKKQMIIHYGEQGENSETFMIVSTPVDSAEVDGIVYVIESLEAMNDTVQATTKLIILAAGVAIILTTIFAFFLSTRITAPLRNMREAAFEIARGKFNTKLPILSTDEIAELAIAFNQMGKQLNQNMNALNQEKENLKSILSSMADGVITFKVDGTILPTNQPAERFMELWRRENDLRGGNTEAPIELVNLFQLSVDTEQENVEELRIGDHYWVVVVSPLYNNENIRGAVAVLRDMTEEKKLEKMRNDFIANVSHELRTPISMLQGYSEAIIDDIAETKEEKQEIARIIYDESLRMGRLVNELLDLAQMEAGHLSLNYESVNLEKYLNRVSSKFIGPAKEKNIELKVQLADPDLTWFFDPDRIEQVLTNLIDNAIRHSQNGGFIAIIQSTEGNQLKIEVKDSGTGIPHEDLPFVFDRFYKADKARTRGKSGTGLGLAIVSNIIKGHHGEISVESKENEGTTFTFKIPRNMQ
ncbi:HAMP domain-containing protein [Bacillus sp. AGMB 02131]|uniref:histidine kinase n=1 Tax=Peribacillus faecalis TaxID=2772559 RepID=A0A927D331_9BACI|nr:ATP-binding protein [Peribacillus faecalis]MBD3110189.1 HAMP domain-containing protein [Peribacillus faecalis]